MSGGSSQRRWRAWLVCAALVAGGAAHAASDAAVLESFRRGLDDQLATWHHSPASIDRDDLLRTIERKLASGESAQAIAAWMPQELSRRWYSFAPIAPAYAPDPLFQLPFDRRVLWLVGQGVGGSQSHTGALKYSFDFLMPEGTPVLAALGGKVVRVVDGFTLCCRKLEEAWQTNEVIIRHPSGLFSSYVHLRKGVVVREGERVAAGALIGYSGSTGYANGPHLHFSVSARKTADSVETIPIRFRNGTPQGFVPKHWHLYDSRAKPGIALRVTIDGTPVVSGQPFPVADHSPVQLKVEILDAAGVGFDVTRSATTEYVALTPWSLRADRMGRVQFDLKTKTWEILPDLIERGIAILTVLTRDANGSEGYFDVWFKFGDVALPKSEAQPGA